ncbi:MAG: dockerin type I domain-containing protein, partial [Candidatus Roizmanbacteria bacterium]
GTGRLFYTFHLEDSELANKISVPLIFKTKEKGTGSVTMTSAKVSGTVKDELYQVNSGTGSFDILDPGSTAVQADMNFILRLHGITEKPGAPRPLNFQIGIAGGPDDMETATKVVTFVSDDQGLFKGSTSFALHPGEKYRTYVKGPQHRKTKVCDNLPQEGTAEVDKGTYQCDKGKMNIVAGTNTFDFSNIIMAAGDLPDPAQDGTINSMDLIACKKRFNSKAPEDLLVCDMKQNGQVDVLDYSLIIQSLRNKQDDL